MAIETVLAKMSDLTNADLNSSSHQFNSELFDNFDLLAKSNKSEIDTQKSKIHVRFQKTGPRSITLVEGLDDDLDMVRISRAWKKSFKCSASIHKDDDGNDVVQLQGDHRTNVRDWLLKEQILTVNQAKERLILHGF